MNKYILAFIAFVALFLSVASVTKPAVAGPYDGPGIIKNILIDKRIGLPHESNGKVTYEFVDNISASTHMFRPSDTVFFELRVKNTSNVALTNVVINDFAPDFFDLFENPGTLDPNNKDILVINAGDFAAGEEKVFGIRGRIVDEQAVSDGVTCTSNRARVTASQVSDEDTAQFCFERPVTQKVVTRVVTKGGTTIEKVTTIPSTGPADSLLIVGLASLFGYAGTRLKKKVQ